jgi:catechol 2,3-dioxygenase-like lactoylglutathione lyase family enzyme
MQELGENAVCTIWWLCGRQDFVQLEFFSHTVPIPNAFPEHWAATDLGWTRIGILVQDFDEVLARLNECELTTYTPPRTYADHRRVALRDPDIAVVIEVIEEGPSVAGGRRPIDYGLAPAIAYAAACVPDLDAAREFFADVVELQELPADSLHTDDMHELWATHGGSRRAAVFDTGTVLLELIEQGAPASRPLPDGYRLCDFSMSHVALGFRDRRDLDRLVARLERAGCALTTPLGQQPAGTYLHAPDGTALEVLSITREHDASYGWVPRSPMARPA